MINTEINPAFQHQDGIKAKLRRWKRKFGANAKFISKEHFPFNCFDEVWTLNGEGSNGTQFKADFFHNKDWDDNVQCDVRRALGLLAKRMAASSLIGSLATLLRTTPLTEFTQPDIEGIWPLLPKHHRNNLKTLMSGLIKVDKAKYNEAFDWIEENHVITKPKFNPYCIETGALSEFEVQSFERELARTMKAKVLELQADTDNYNSQVAKLTSIKPLIALRLLYALVRRPTNLRQLKWNDILPVGASFQSNEAEMIVAGMSCLDFSDEDELQVRIWKSKDSSTFRTSVERYSLRLNAKISTEVLHYRLAYRHCLGMRLDALKIEVTEEELDTLIMRSPVIYNFNLLKTRFADKRELFNAISTQGSGYHEKSDLICKGISKAINRMDLKSDRVTNMKVGNNRIRHTVATLAAMLGFDGHHISNLLGNTLASAVQYIDMCDEMRVNLDNNYIGNNKLKQYFKADLSTLLEDERYTIMDDRGNEAGQAKNRKSCATCDEIKRPLACYGCDNFQALEDGAHRAIRDDGQRLYDKRIADGDPSFLLGKLSTQIMWVNATIAICDERIASRNILNAE